MNTELSNLQKTKAFVMRSFWVGIIDSHKFFVRESKFYVGVQKKDRSKSYPTFGMITDYRTKPFNPKNKVWGMNGIEYQKYYAYKLKDLLYYPIAYCKFMRYCVTDIVHGVNYTQ